jgi:hypothetical protein
MKIEIIEYLISLGYELDNDTQSIGFAKQMYLHHPEYIKDTKELLYADNPDIYYNADDDISGFYECYKKGNSKAVAFHPQENKFLIMLEDDVCGLGCCLGHTEEHLIKDIINIQEFKKLLLWVGVKSSY